jgi:hypothetical protein
LKIINFEIALVDLRKNRGMEGWRGVEDRKFYSDQPAIISPWPWANGGDKKKNDGSFIRNPKRRIPFPI